MDRLSISKFMSFFVCVWTGGRMHHPYKKKFLSFFFTSLETVQVRQCVVSSVVNGILVLKNDTRVYGDRILCTNYIGYLLFIISNEFFCFKCDLLGFLIERDAFLELDVVMMMQVSVFCVSSGVNLSF